MESERAERCETCRFWCDASSTTTDENNPELHGWCHRYPPTVKCPDEGSDDHPWTAGDDWCGEWQPNGPPTIERKCPQLLSTYEASKRLHLTPIAVRKFAKKGDIRSVVMPGDRYCFIESDLAEWVDQHRQPKQ